MTDLIKNDKVQQIMNLSMSFVEFSELLKENSNHDKRAMEMIGHVLDVIDW